MAITIKQPDGIEITVDTPEEYNLVMGLNGHEEKAGDRIVFLRQQFWDVLDCFKNFPDGLDSPQVASLLSIPNGTASSRCNRLAKDGLITRRLGHNGYVLSEEFKAELYDVRVVNKKQP